MVPSPACQQPSYPDRTRLDGAIGALSALPPLVTSWEIERLKTPACRGRRGRRFLLQGGACAERFDQCSAAIITNKLKVLLQMSLVLTYGLRRRIIRVGRFAGQYAKPRSSDSETRDGVTLPSYRGDLVNGPEFTEEARIPDPDRLIRGYQISSLTLNFIRSLVEGGFADLRHPEYWDLDFVEHSPRAKEYQRMVESISDSIRFMEVLADSQVGEIGRVDFFTSHEGLHLPYEQAVTRQVPRREGWYNLGTHLPWLGMRTCEIRWRSRRVLPRHPQPHRSQNRPRHDPRLAHRAHRGLGSRRRARSTDPHSPFRAWQSGRRPAAVDPCGSGDRPSCRLVLRSYARQHRNNRRRHQDPAL